MKKCKNSVVNSLEMNQERFDSNQIEIEWFDCNNEAKEWKIQHMP